MLVVKKFNQRKIFFLEDYITDITSECQKMPAVEIDAKFMEEFVLPPYLSSDESLSGEVNNNFLTQN